MQRPELGSALHRCRSSRERVPRDRIMTLARQDLEASKGNYFFFPFFAPFFAFFAPFFAAMASFLFSALADPLCFLSAFRVDVRPRTWRADAAAAGLAFLAGRLLPGRAGG